MGSSESTLTNDQYEDDSAAAEDDASAKVIGAVLVLAFVFLLAYVAVTLCFGSKTAAANKKTMKAPGKDARIARDKFEKDPKQYFRSLRKK